MTLQHSPLITAGSNLAQYKDQVDAAAHANDLSAPREPPPYGEPQREAINSCVNSLVQDLCDKIDGLKKTLDTIKQQVLESAAGSKQTLNGLVTTYVRVNGEILDLQDVIADIKSKTRGT